MAKTSTMPGWQLALVILTGTVVGVVVVTCLYWAQTVFIPVALAVFLTVLLAPLVAALQRRGLRRLAEHAPALVCIGALRPGGLAHTRYLCKKLRARFPKVKIVVGRWGLTGNVETNREQLQDAGADLMGTTVLETRSQLNSLLPILTQQQGKPMTI